MKRILILLAASFSLLVAASPASAFDGPWDSAHAPATVQSSLVSIVNFGETLDIQLDGLLCPAIGPDYHSTAPPNEAYETIADPRGSITVHYLPSWEDSSSQGCFSRQAAQVTSTGNPDFAYPFGGWEIQPRSHGSTPYLYTVWTPTQGILAQDVYTYVYVSPTDRNIYEDTNWDEFWNVCINGPERIWSASGRLYCTTSEGGIGPDFSHGWPKPPPVCTVPNLRGKALAGARSALGHAFCGLGRVSRPRHIRPHHTLRVASQSSGAGTAHPRGYPVNVTLR